MRFAAESIIAASPERVFAFHELPDALVRLTPPWEKMRVIQHAPSLRAGARAILEVRIVPLLWMRTESVHTLYDPPFAFEDEQVRGPFRRWHHRHSFTPFDGGTRLTDLVDYALPLGFPLPLIAPRLRRVFAYRHEVTREWCERVTRA